MSQIKLLPRLSPAAISGLLADWREQGFVPATPSEIQSRVRTFTSFGATGGTRDWEAPFRVAGELRRLASELGFPDPPDRWEAANFDASASRTLAEHEDLQTGEVLRSDVWSFIATVAGPDVVEWRFPDAPEDRFRGGIRDAFWRLWVRGRALDRGRGAERRWALLEELSEDSLVQLFERRTIGNDPLLARAVAEAWLETAQLVGRGRMEKIFREASKLIRMRLQIFDFALLPFEVLHSTLLAAFREAAAGEGLTVPTGSQPRLTPNGNSSSEHRPELSRAGADRVTSDEISQEARCLMDDLSPLIGTWSALHKGLAKLSEGAPVEPALRGEMRKDLQELGRQDVELSSYTAIAEWIRSDDSG